MKLNTKLLIHNLSKMNTEPVEAFHEIVIINKDELNDEILEGIAREVRNLDAKILGITVTGQIFLGYRR